MGTTQVPCQAPPLEDVGGASEGEEVGVACLTAGQDRPRTTRAPITTPIITLNPRVIPSKETAPHLPWAPHPPDTGGHQGHLMVAGGSMGTSAGGLGMGLQGVASCPPEEGGEASHPPGEEVSVGLVVSLGGYSGTSNGGAPLTWVLSIRDGITYFICI